MVIFYIGLRGLRVHLYRCSESPVKLNQNKNQPNCFMKNLIIILLAVTLSVSLIANGAKNSIVNKPPTNQLITTRGQALVTDNHLLIADVYGSIYDLSGINMSKVTYQSLLMGGHRIYAIDPQEDGKLHIRKIEQAN